VLEDTAKPEAEPEVGVNNNGWLVFVEAKTTLIFCAVVAVPEVVAFPTDNVDCATYVGVAPEPAEVNT